MRNRGSIKYRWYIAQIDGEAIGTLSRELKRIPHAENVKVYIPTVKIIRKEHKGKKHFDKVPMVIGYGFFKVPVSWAMNHEFMASLQSGITCLTAWVRDPARLSEPSTGLTRKERSRMSPIAEATKAEIKSLINEEDKLKLHSKKDIKKLKPGDIITLRGKPFDSLQAEVVEIDLHRKKVIVKIGAGTMLDKVSVEFENVFYSVYTGDMDERVGRHMNIDDCYRTGTLDNFEVDL
jgi:transcription antitermination factor NusG